MLTLTTSKVTVTSSCDLVLGVLGVLSVGVGVLLSRDGHVVHDDLLRGGVQDGGGVPSVGGGERRHGACAQADVVDALELLLAHDLDHVHGQAVLGDVLMTGDGCDVSILGVDRHLDPVVDLVPDAGLPELLQDAAAGLGVELEVAGVELDRDLAAVVVVERAHVVHGDAVSVGDTGVVFCQVMLVDVDSDHRHGGQDEYHEADRENRVSLLFLIASHFTVRAIMDLL